MSTLKALPDDWERAMCVMAHPDDMEYGGAAAVARWTQSGRHVTYLMATHGEAGIDAMTPEDAAVIRQAEQIDSARVVGVETVGFLDHPDGMLTEGLPLRRDIAAEIRRRRPELVVVNNYRETWPGGMLNMADHRVCGLAAVDAVRDAANRWVFRDLLDAGLDPWDGVRYIALLASPDATHGVDVTDTFDRGVESLRRHASYLAGLGDGPDPDEFLRPMAEAAGTALGVRYAVSFELLRT